MATMKNKVIWQEGLFALPQHFQQQQRNHEYHLNQRMTAQGDFAWGFTSLMLNAGPGENHDRPRIGLYAGRHGIQYP